MANTFCRLYQTPGIIRVSPPGIDARTASFGNLLLSEQYRAAQWMENGISPTVERDFAQQTVFFSQAYSFIPLIDFHEMPVGDSTYIAGNQQACYWPPQGLYYFYSQDQRGSYAEVSNDRIVFTNQNRVGAHTITGYYSEYGTRLQFLWTAYRFPL